MIRIRRSAQRGHFRNHWLDAHFSFSFGAYRDPDFDGWSDLLVFNDDRVAPGGGFAGHGHDNVEVMSYPLEGAVEHRDSLGNVAIMRPGDVHLMRAGRGIRHSEMNASASEPEHHLQWWIAPATRGLEPGYQRIHLSAQDKHNRWRPIASADGAEGSLAIAQDVRVYASRLASGSLSRRLDPARRAFVQVATGAAAVGGSALAGGDALFIEGESVLTLDALPGGAELLLFDLRGADASPLHPTSAARAP
jgi:quercetin 2,3-dioxygenase